MAILSQPPSSIEQDAPCWAKENKKMTIPAFYKHSWCIHKQQLFTIALYISYKLTDCKVANHIYTTTHARAHPSHQGMEQKMTCCNYAYFAFRAIWYIWFTFFNVSQFSEAGCIILKVRLRAMCILLIHVFPSKDILLHGQHTKWPLCLLLGSVPESCKQIHECVYSRLL